MRIAVTGTHGVGKSTLIEDFVAGYPRYAHVQEPYWELAQRGVSFADGATTADLEEQLGQSCAMIVATPVSEVIFDRSPLDFVAYLEVVSREEGFEWEPDGKMLRQIEKAVGSLDLLAFVPLTSPDEIEVSIEHPKLRMRVDRRLKALIRNDEMELLGDKPRVVEIGGTRPVRVRQLASALTRR